MNDYIVWAIVFLFSVFAVTPALLSNDFQQYKVTLRYSIITHVFILITACVLFAVGYALMWLLN